MFQEIRRLVPFINKPTSEDTLVPRNQLEYARAKPTKTAKKKSKSRRAGKARKEAVTSSPLATNPELEASSASIKSTNDGVCRPTQRKTVEICSKPQVLQAKPQSEARVAPIKSTNEGVLKQCKIVETRNKAQLSKCEADKTKQQSGRRSVNSTHTVVRQQRKVVGSRNKTQSVAKCKAAKSEKETSNGGKSILRNPKTSKIPSKTSWCSYCKETLNTEIEVELHVISIQHKVKVNSDSDKKWLQRKPPLNVLNGDYKMCERSATCRRVTYCAQAHNEDELKEWRERYEYRMKKIRQSFQELSSVVKYDYNFDNSLLKDAVDGVECKENGKVHRKINAPERINNKSTCTFKFILKCTGEKKLKRVFLLHDEHRDNFYFTQPLEEDKPQICPGNKLIGNDYITCTVSVKFVSFSSGHFDQWVIFDLGQKVYMKREISVHVGLQEDVDIPMNRDSIQLNSSPWKNVIPFEERPEFQQKLLDKAQLFKPNITDDKLLKEKLSEKNYTIMMHRFIDIEEREQQTIIETFNLNTKISVCNKFHTDSTGASNMIIAQRGELFGKINLKKALDFDSLAGILILESVNSVACRFYSNTTRATFEAKIYRDGTADGRTEENVYVIFNDRCVSEMNLKDGSEHEAEVKFLIDRIPFVEMHFAIQNLKEMHFVWPKKSKQLTIVDDSPELDKYQETAARFICSKEIRHEQAPLVICGPFGTGKTRVLATSVKRILEQSDDSRILICTLSNSAADLYITDGIQEESDRFIKASDAYKILRVYQPNRRVSTISQRVKEHCLFETKTKSKLRVPKRDDIEKAKVVICTLATAIYLIPLNVKGSFTHILIDEAGQALEPQTIMPLALADEKTGVVIAGDHLQMSPKIYSKSSKDVKFHISLLERLKKMDMTRSVLLRRNYRTCRPILEFLSSFIYEKGIECAVYEKFNLDFPAMSLVEVKGLDTKQGSSYVNKDESTELVQHVKHLHEHWPENFGEKDIAVVTSYHAQVILIRKLLRKRGMKDIVVEHVRNIQGRQFRVVFISTVRTRKTLNLDEITAIKGNDFISTHKYGFLSDVKLLNTAFTRAKSMVVVVGDPVALCSAGECCLFWIEYVKRCETLGGILPKSLTFDKVMYNTRQKLNPTAKAFKPSSSIRKVQKLVPKHNISKNENKDIQQKPVMPSLQNDTKLGIQLDHYRRKLAEQQREAKLNDVILRELKLGEQNDDLEENDDIQNEKSKKKHKTKHNWRKLENYEQIIEGRDIKYIPSREEDVLEHSIDYWLAMCEKTPEKYKHCTFNIDSTGNMFAIDNNTGKHISITSARRRCTAFEKDTVVVQVLGNDNNDCNNGICGVVKCVIERHSNPHLQEFVCKLDSRTNNLMVPLNISLPKFAILGMENSTYPKARFKIYKVSDGYADEEEPLVQTNFEEVSITDRPNALFIVRYLKWYPKYIYPLGCVTKRLPLGDSLDSGLQIISLEHNVEVPGEWSESVEKEVKESKKFHEKWQIPESEIGDRLDLRKESVFTIDPIDSKDLDDALSVTNLSDGHYKVGVHISDVSYFVQIQSEMDLEAKKRCISHYPTSAKPIHMIHKNLSSNKCSLIPNKDRLTISVIFKIDEEGFPVKDGTNIVRSIVNSRNQFSYKEVEEIIHKRSNGPSENLTKQIRLLNQLAIKRRETRLKSGRFCYNHDDVTDDLDCPLAHSLVEEFMLLANETVATFLTTSFPKCVPLRRQLPPDSDKMQEWIQAFNGSIKNSLQMSAKIPDLPEDSSCNMTLTKDVWNKLVNLLETQQNKQETSGPKLISDDKDFFELIDLVANDMLHPQLMLMKLKYINIQFKSDYVCSGRDGERHHSLSLSHYTHFTSPIRRYIDLVVHRLLVAALKKDQPPYTPKEIEDICSNMNEKAINAKHFQRRTRDLVLALDLKKRGALRYQPVIDSVDDTNIYLAFPQSYINRSQTPLGFNYLKPSERVVTTDEISTVTWKINLCDACDKSSLLLSLNMNELSRLDPARFIVEMESKDWQKLVNAITSGTQTDVRNTLSDCMKNIHIKRESRKEKLLVDMVKYEKFECKFQRFDVMRVHLAPELRNGMLQPTIQLVSLAENIEVCLEHRKNPVLCFSRLAADNPRDSKSIERYRTTWLSVLSMCSAYGAVHEDNATIIRNVDIKWQPDDSGSFTGSFKLLEEFCDSNMLRFFRKSMKKKRNENQNNVTTDTRALDFLCVRYSNLQCPPRSQDSKPTHLRGKSTDVWVGHCYTTDVNDITESNKTYLIVHLKLNQSAIPLPFGQIRTQEALCTVELIPKSPPDSQDEVGLVLVAWKLTTSKIGKKTISTDSHVDLLLLRLRVRCFVRRLQECGHITETEYCRRTEEAVLGLYPSRSETSMTRCIVLQRKIISNRDELTIRESLNENCSNWKIYPIPECPNASALPPPNFPQRNAIEKAISQTFTVIQGPPGTGKSVTGSQLAFFFAQINKHVKANNRPQVLYCGPSNKSVEVVAGYLKRLSGIKVVRVYSESIEDKDYPRPWLTKPKRKFSIMEASVDPKNRDIALHHLIRQKRNPLSREIQQMEAEFTKRIEDYRKATSRTSSDNYDAQTKKQLKLKITKEEFKTYNTLIKKAKKEELQNYDVILTTCNVAGASDIRRFCNIIECIIDEAGMCTEPESLIPLIGCTPHKVVLIGDHKQLRPIVQEPNARELGMEISLLERYADEAIMLNIQYRMHRSICDFPSQHFYNDKLKTDMSVDRRKPDTLNWPTRDGNKEYHTLFCHVDGKEESQTVKTEEGNENSRCNQQEIEALMKVVQKLLEKRIVAKDILVLTQYRLQLNEIKTRLNKDSRTREVRAATVITSQGSESDYVIMSTVRSIPLVQIEEKPTLGWKKKFLGFIIDENQTNVALTRAKRGLILIGNKHLLETHETWRNLIKSYEDRGCLMYNMDFLTTF